MPQFVMAKTTRHLICRRFSRALVVVFAVLLAGANLARATEPTEADERLEIFLKQTQSLIDEGERIVVDGLESPFLAYLDRPFEEGLDTPEQAQFDKKMATGDCHAVARLGIKGFLGLYPFLSPAFDRSYRGGEQHPNRHADKLTFALNRYMSPEIQYCYNLKEFRRIFAIQKPNAFDAWDFKQHSPPLSELGLRPSDVDSRRYFALYSLGKLAFCHDYSRAMRDVLVSGNRHGGMVLPEEEELYLVLRLRAHGKKVPDTKTRLSRLKASLSKARFYVLSETAPKAGIADLDRIAGYWQRTCARWRKDYRLQGRHLGPLPKT